MYTVLVWLLEFFAISSALSRSKIECLYSAISKNGGSSLEKIHESVKSRCHLWSWDPIDISPGGKTLSAVMEPCKALDYMFAN